MPERRARRRAAAPGPSAPRASRLCVAISAERPVSRTRSISASKTRSEVAGSRLPVGSSASSSAARWPAPGRRPRAAARRPTARAGRWSGAALDADRSRRSRARASASARGDAVGELRQDDVLQRRELGQQVVELVDEAHVARRAAVRAAVAEAGHVGARRARDAPRVGRVQQARDMQQRRLARARGGDQRHHLARAPAQRRRRAAPPPRWACRGCRPWRRRREQAQRCSLIAQRLDRVHPRGAAGREEVTTKDRTSDSATAESTSPGSQLGRQAVDAPDRRVPDAAARDLVHERRRSGRCRSRTGSRGARPRSVPDHADQRAAEEEDPQDRALGQAHRAQDADVAALVLHQHDEARDDVHRRRSARGRDRITNITLSSTVSAAGTRPRRPSRSRRSARGPGGVQDRRGRCVVDRVGVVDHDLDLVGDALAVEEALRLGEAACRRGCGRCRSARR